MSKRGDGSTTLRSSHQLGCRLAFDGCSQKSISSELTSSVDGLRLGSLSDESILFAANRIATSKLTVGIQRADCTTYRSVSFPASQFYPQKYCSVFRWRNLSALAWCSKITVATSRFDQSILQLYAKFGQNLDARFYTGLVGIISDYFIAIN